MANNIIKKESVLHDTGYTVNTELGMPHVFKMSSSLLGIIHPYKKDEFSGKFCVFLTVYEWIQGKLKKKASIKLYDGF